MALIMARYVRGAPTVCAIFLFCLSGLDSAAAAQPAAAAQVLAGSPELRYEVSIQGVDNLVLRETLRFSSTLVARQDRPPDSMLVLERMAERDIMNLLRALRAEAFYGAIVTPEIDHTVRPIRVTLHVQTGPEYLFEHVEIDYVERPAVHPQPLPAVYDLSLSLYTPALTEDIRMSQSELVVLLSARGFPYPDALQPLVTVDHATRGVRVIYPVVTGPSAYFDEIEFRGNDTVRETFLRARIPWESGELYDRRLLAEYNEWLTQTGLFAVASVGPEPELDDEGRIPILVSLRERLHRSIRAGISYRTDEGLGARVSWQHRNLFGRGRDLMLRARVTELDSEFETIYIVPQFLRADQTLRLRAGVLDEDTVAYRSRSAQVSGLVEREITRRMMVGAGLGYRAARVTQFEESNTYNLISAPAFLSADTSVGDPLNPVGGGRLMLRVTPFVDVTDTGTSFVRSHITYSHYLAVTQVPPIVLAGRISAGGIAGLPRDRIPADERFYTGGGGTVRGYEYLTIGPLRDGVPVGGRSLLELAIEARTRISENIEIVPFIDGGSVLNRLIPISAASCVGAPGWDCVIIRRSGRSVLMWPCR